MSPLLALCSRLRRQGRAVTGASGFPGPRAARLMAGLEGDALLRREHGAEADLVGHDLGPGLLGAVEGEGLDAGLHVVELAEGDRLLGIDGGAAGPARQGPA